MSVIGVAIARRRVAEGKSQHVAAFRLVHGPCRAHDPRERVAAYGELHSVARAHAVTFVRADEAPGSTFESRSQRVFRDSSVSPLLTMRAPVSVNLRLAAACAVTGLLAVIVAAGSGDVARPTAAAPVGLAIGTVCAAIVAHILHASRRTLDDCRLDWMAAGVTIAFAGLLVNLAGQPGVFPSGGPVTQGPDPMTARYLIWHAGLLAAGILAVVRVAPTRRAVVAFAGGWLALLLYASVAAAPFGDLAEPVGGYAPAVKVAAVLLAAGQLAVAGIWWRAAERAPAWGEICVIAVMLLSAGDVIAYLFASSPYEGAWWASLTLRAGQFAVPAVGLLIGFIAVADRLRDLQDELARNLEVELERARREEELVRASERRRAHVRERISRLIAGDGVEIALQPILDLTTRDVVGAEALARFTDAEGTPVPTEDCFGDAHALDLGVDLELTVLRRALSIQDRLAEGLYLAVNVSPALLGGPDLQGLVARRNGGRPLVLELTEHQPVEDYGQLAEALEKLRAHGIRVAVDDVGSGFASFRHVTRVNPEILKLDRTLVTGIDEDPVRQSLAAAIVSFAQDVGATVVSEGIESEGELACLMDLAVRCGQGFYLARPGLGPVA
jgi:EAL domain-containing protein (putative c-di-GMP-specific phosphodiesterase class I)